MLYLKHDFYSNFTSSVDAGDNYSITDLVTNEISEIIVYKREELIDMLTTVGVSVNANKSDELIVIAILNEIPKNNKLIKGLAFMIFENNQNENTGKDKKENFSKIDNVASGIIGLGDSFEHHPQMRKEFKNNLLDKIEVKAKAVGDRKIKIRENNSGKYIALGILVVVVCVGIYLIHKYKDKLIIDSPQLVPTPPQSVVASQPTEVVSTTVETPIVATNLAEPMAVIT